jgi:hypothetical protein
MHKAALVPILAAAIGVYACSEETKVKVLKYKLRRAKLEDPRNTLPAKNFVSVNKFSPLLHGVTFLCVC